MARNGSGTYAAPANSWNPAVGSTTISSTDWAALLSDLETALTGSIAKDGQTPTTAVIPFANGIKTDTVAEQTSNTGVTVDGVLLKDGGFIANETGADVDCRIEGDTDANLFYTDAGNDRVGIGTATPSTKLDVSGTVTATGLASSGDVTVADNVVHSGDTDNKIAFGTDTQDFQTGGSSRLDISDSGVRLGAANARVTTILDEDDMSSDSATALATQQSIKAYVDGKQPTVATITLLNPWAQNTTAAVAHGIGEEPWVRRLILECISPDANYTTGDRIDLSASQYTINDQRGYTILIDATNVTIITDASAGRQPLIADKTTRAMTTISSGSWKLLAEVQTP